MKLAPEEITTMQALEGLATPAPWTAWKGNNAVYYGTASINVPSHYASAGPDSFAVCQTDDMRYDELEELEPGTPEDDAAFIAAARNFLPRAIEHIRFTEASTEEALLILDDAQANAGTLTDAQLLQMMDAAAQKLRGVQVSPEDAELVALAKRHPIDLPWMQVASADLSAVPVPELQRMYRATGEELSRRPRDFSQPAVMAIATPSLNPPTRIPVCSPEDCQQCQVQVAQGIPVEKGGEAE